MPIAPQLYVLRFDGSGYYHASHIRQKTDARTFYGMGSSRLSYPRFLHKSC